MRRISTLFMVLAIGALGVMSPQGRAYADEPDELPGALPVKDALAKLGKRAEEVAHAHGGTEAEWKAQINDKSVWIDRKGALFYKDPAPEKASLAAPAAVAATSAYPYAQTFLLHSNPTSTRKLYLDFDGHVATGTSWSSSTLTGTAFSIDADLTTFSNTEQDVIQQAWQHVSEDYAPFNIDVTTQDPGAAGLTQTSTADHAFGSRVVITGAASVYTALCGSCGGIAYINGIGKDQQQPAWVFTNGVGFDAKSIAEAASHEAGHNLGLRHDGTPTLGYYEGQGSWAPIMGVGYYRPVTQWSQGEYTGANNVEDDLAIIAAHDVPLGGDDFGSLAAPSNAGPSPVKIAGIISTRSDQDGFQFSSGAGAVTFSATPAAVGADLDIGLSLVNAAGTVVASANPAVATLDANSASGLNATITATVPAGIYRVVVDGLGSGTAAATGYSDYGSLGRYTLSGTYPTSATNQAPVAVATVNLASGSAPLAVTFSAARSTDVDGVIASYAWSFSGGGTAVGATATRTYTSAGSFSATVTVTDDKGAMSTATVSVTVSAAGTATTIISGVAVAPLADAVAATRLFQLAVPVGADRLDVVTSGGVGNLDLFVKAGVVPTTAVFDCSSVILTSAETCTIFRPTPGTYYIMTKATAAFSGVTLVATATIFPALISGVARTGLASVTAGAKQYFKMIVPAGKTSLTIAMSGGSGDGDLYVRPVDVPSLSTYACRPYTGTNNETCTVTNPATGTWYVMIDTYQPFSGVSLVGTLA